MTNKEKYKKAFSALESQECSFQEIEQMAALQKKTKMKITAAIVTGCVLLGGTGTAYAMNVGGIQRMVQIWMHGEQTNAVLDVTDDGIGYSITWKDENGEEREVSGGGIAYELNGKERPLTAEEYLEEWDSPDVEYLDDGSVWVYYRDQKIDITDKFDKDGICYVQVKDGKDPIYMTIKYQNGWGCDSKKYPDPKELWGVKQ